MNFRLLTDAMDEIINEGSVRVEVIRKMQIRLEELINESSEQGYLILLEGIKLFNQQKISSYKKAREQFQRLKIYEELKPYRIFLLSACYYFLDEFDQGIKILKESMQDSNSREDLVLEALGFFYTDLKKYAQAIESFDGAVALNSKRKSLCQWGKAIVLCKLNKRDEAENCYKQSLEGSVDNRARGLEGLAELALIQDKHEEAFDILNRALEEPNLSEWSKVSLLRTRANVFYDVDREMEGIQDLKSALSLNGHNLDHRLHIYKRLADLYIELDDLESARQAIEDGSHVPIESERKASLNFVRAELLFMENEADSALANLDKIAQGSKDPTWIREVHKRKFSHYLDENKVGLAKIEIDKLSKMAEENSHKVDVLRKKAKLNISQGRKDEALDNLKQALSLNEDLGIRRPLLRQHSDLLLEMGKIDEAEIELKSALENEVGGQQSALAWRALAQIERERGNFEEAIHNIDKSLELWKVPRHQASCLIVKSNIYKAEGIYFKAFQSLDDALKLDFPNAFKFNVLMAKGKLSRETQKFEEALEIIDKAAATLGGNKPNPICLYEMALTLEGLGDVAKAIDKYREAFRSEKSSDFRSVIKFREGVLCFENQKYPEAVEAFRMSLELNSKGPSIIALYLAFSLVKEQSDDLKLTVLDSFSKMGDIEKCSVHIAKGWWFYANRRFGEAIKSFEIANVCEDHPLAGFVKFYLASAYFELGQNKEALKLAKQAENFLSTGESKNLMAPYSVQELLAKVHEQSEELFIAKDYLERAIAGGSRNAIGIFEIDNKISRFLKKGKDREKAFEEEMIQQENKSKNSISLRNNSMKIGNHRSDKIIESIGNALIFGNPHLGESFRNGFEYTCHYTSAETALFHILPSQYNHDFGNETKVIQLRLNPLGQANDIEEGEFKLNLKQEDKTFPERLFSSLKTQIKEEFKVFCMSWSNVPFDEITYSSAPFLIPPMWSRYGRVHTGVVIIFDLEKFRACVEEFFAKNEYSIFALKRVIYGYPGRQVGVKTRIDSDELLQLNTPVDLKSVFKERDGSVNVERLNALFFKPPHWNYEREIRLVAQIGKPGPIPMKIPSSCIRGIILGSQCKRGFRKMFNRACEDNDWFLLEHNPTSEGPHGALSRVG